MVLVTGASGFLGRNLVQRLSAQGSSVRALYHRHPPSAEQLLLPNVQWRQCDLLDIFEVEEVMQGVTDIYHCAGIVAFDLKRREEMLHFNPESTANIVNQALQQNIRKLVYVSSVSALGRPGEADKEISEEEEWGESRYNSAYGLSKYLAEMEMWRGIGEGLNAVIVNPGVILGPGKITDLPLKLMKLAFKEFPFYTRGVTSWVGLDDTVSALTMLMASEINSERFIISAGNFSYREIVTKMAAALKKKPPRYHATPLLTGIVWRFNTLKSKLGGSWSLISRETSNNASSISIYNNDKFLKEFPGFEYTPMEQVIEQMARSFLIELNQKIPVGRPN